MEEIGVLNILAISIVLVFTSFVIISTINDWAKLKKEQKQIKRR